MYKITLFDENTCSFVTGTVSFFVDSINEFEDVWLKNPLVSDEQKSRYLMSKEGNLVSDYYVDTEENNILQQDSDALILEQADFLLKNREFRLHNFYECESVVYAKEAQLKFRKIHFKGKCYWIGRYYLAGVCLAEDLERDVWKECPNLGNKILNIVNPKEIFCKEIKKKCGCGKETFEKYIVETICWVTIAASMDNKAYPFCEEYLLSDKTMDRLMCDILGEAG